MGRRTAGATSAMDLAHMAVGVTLDDTSNAKSAMRKRDGIQENMCTYLVE